MGGGKAGARNFTTKYTKGSQQKVGHCAGQARIEVRKPAKKLVFSAQKVHWRKRQKQNRATIGCPPRFADRACLFPLKESMIDYRYRSGSLRKSRMPQCRFRKGSPLALQKQFRPPKQLSAIIARSRSQNNSLSLYLHKGFCEDSIDSLGGHEVPLARRKPRLCGKCCCLCSLFTRMRGRGWGGWEDDCPDPHPRPFAKYTLTTRSRSFFQCNWGPDILPSCLCLGIPLIQCLSEWSHTEMFLKTSNIRRNDYTYLKGITYT